MKETVERVTERHGGKAAPVKHLYRRQYQISGEDWHDLVRYFHGLEREAAEEGLSVLEARSIKWEDFRRRQDQTRRGVGIMELKREHLIKCRSPACR